MNGSKLLTTAIIICLLSALIWFGLTRDKPIHKQQVPTQEFTKFQVVQMYLHMPKGDYIINRQNASFQKAVTAVESPVLKINQAMPEYGVVPDKGPAQEENQETIETIKRKYVAVSLWLMQPQKISTSIKPGNNNDAGEGAALERDKYGNQVISTDRILIVLGGRLQGKVFVRDPVSGNWHVFSTGNVVSLIELVRVGGL